MSNIAKIAAARITAAAAVAIGLSAPGALAEEPIRGVYVSLGAGTNVALPEDLTLTGPTTTTVDTEYGYGFVGEAAVGVWLPWNLRLEAEFAYRDSPLDGTLATSAGPLDFSGGAEVSTLMANLAFEYPILSEVSIFAGAGAGVAYVDSDITRGAAGGNAVVANGNDTRFAYQGMLGLRWQFLNDTSAYVKYSYLGTTGTDYTFVNQTGGSTTADLDYSTQSIMLGVTFNFGGF